MNRREFLKRSIFAAAAIALSPELDLAPIIEAPSAVCFDEEIVAWVTFTFQMYVDNPAHCCRIDGIT